MSTSSAPDAQLYAALHRGTPGDVAFYIKAAEHANNVLELGCGSGRILIPIAQSGVPITGLDFDADALALAKRDIDALDTPLNNSATLIHGDMRSFQLDNMFDRIFMPYNALYCLEDDNEMVACLQNVRAHLAPGGVFVFDAYAIDEIHHADSPIFDDSDNNEDDVAIAALTWHGDILDVFETTLWDRDRQRLEVNYRYLPRRGSTTLRQTINHHYLLTEQVADLCASAELMLVGMHGDFDGSPLQPDSQHMVCMASADG